MHQAIAMYFALAIALTLTACGGAEPETTQAPASSKAALSASENDTASEPVEDPTPAPQSTPETVSNSEILAEDTSKKIVFLVDGQEIVVTLEDHPAADALYDRLPMELSFEDFNSTEKISYLDEELPTDGAPTQCDPDIGSLCYYIPWGNLSFFYQDFRASESLMPLGQVTSGLELLPSLDTSGTVTVEMYQ